MPLPAPVDELLRSAAGHLSKRRWCGNKGARRMKVHESIPFFSSKRVESFGAVLSFPPSNEKYFAPFIVSGKGAGALAPLRVGRKYLGEAETNSEFVEFALESLRRNRKMNVGGSVLTWKGTGVPRGKLTGPKQLGGDTTNAVVSFNVGKRRAVLKSYRTLDPFNPEPELLGALSAHGCPSTPRVLGSWALRPKSGGQARPTVLGVLLEHLEGHDTFRTFVDSATRTIRLGDIDSLLPAALAGRTVGELHRHMGALRGRDLAPERATKGDVGRWQTRVADEYHEAMKLLSGDEMKRLAWAAKELGPLVEQMKVLEGCPKIRTHQDLHLGQILHDRKKKDMKVIDFEGEPMRRGAERIEKLPPERDVATMLRSFSYAAAVGLMEFEKARQGGHKRNQPKDSNRTGSMKRELASARARMWEEAVSSTFLMWYMSRTPLPPDGPEGFLRRVDLWLAEKALYEIIYEARFRPDWVGIPLGGLLGVLERRSGG